MPWLNLSIAILSEVIGTSALKATEGCTRLVPSLVVLVAYGFSFYFLSLTLRDLPLGIAYAIWCGVGVVLVAVIGWVVYHQPLDLPAVLGIALVVAGVAVLNLFSRTLVR